MGLLAFDRVVILNRELIIDDPDYPYHRRNLAVTLGTIADYLIDQGDAGAGRSRLQEAVRELEALVREFPENQMFIVDLSTGQTRVGDFEVSLENLDAAELAYRAAFTTLKEYIEEPKPQLSFVEVACHALEELGSIEFKRGNEAAADRYYSDAVELARKLATADPGEESARSNLALRQREYGGFLMAAGKSAVAVSVYSAALQNVREMARAAVDTSSHLMDVVSLEVRIGDVQQELGELDAALESYAAALEVAVELTAIESTARDSKRNVFALHLRLGGVNRQLERLDEARDHFEKGVRAGIALLEENPDDTGIQLPVVAAHIQLLRLSVKMNEGEPLMELVDVGRQLLSDLEQAGLRDSEEAQEMSELLRELASLKDSVHPDPG